MAVVFGLALGVSSAAIAASKGEKVEVLADKSGARATPTLVTYRDNEKLVGHSAKQALHRNSKNTSSHMTELIDRDYDDLDSTLQSSVMCEVVRGEVVRGEVGKVCYSMEIDGKKKTVKVSEPLTEIFHNLYETAGSFSREKERAAVLAVPAHLTESQKSAIRACCKSAGFEVMRIISEPSAACLAHGIGQSSRHDESLVLVYDLGAESLTLTLLHVVNGLYRIIKTGQTSSVGGRVLDNLIADYLADEFQRQWKVKISDNRKARFKLLAAAESAKHALSSLHTTSVHLDSVYDGMDLQCSLSRGRFEGISSSSLQSCLRPLTSFLREAGVDREQLDHVIAVGGSCKIPQVQRLLKGEFPSSEFHSSPSADIAIVTGCAVQASLMVERWRRRRSEMKEEEEEEREKVLCVPFDVIITDKQTSHKLVSANTPLPYHKSTYLKFPVSVAMETLCLEVKELKSSGDKEIAEVCVPVRGEEVSVRVNMIWTADNKVTIATKDTASDWSSTIPLQCETISN